MANQAAASRALASPAGDTAASSAVHSRIPPNRVWVTETGPLSRLSSGLRAFSEVMGRPSTVVTAPVPVLVAGTGNAYGSLLMTLPVSVIAAGSLTTSAVSVMLHRPSVLPTGLLLPS